MARPAPRCVTGTRHPGPRHSETEVAEMNDELIEDPVFNYRLRFHPQDGDVLRMDIYVDPGGGGGTPRFHPVIEERSTVVEGETTFTADRKPIVARAGDDSVVLEPGVRPSFKKTGGG